MDKLMQNEIVFTIDQIPVVVIDPKVREDGTVVVRNWGESLHISPYAKFLYPTWQAARIADLERKIQSKKELLARDEEELNKYKNRDRDSRSCETKDSGGY